jgi:AcrR family transcriptional regulator
VTPDPGGRRLRVMAALVELVGTRGYADVSVAEVASSVGVPRASFYELFKDKEACFLDAHRQLSGELEQRAGEHVASSRPQDAAEAAIRAIASTDPVKMCFLFDESMASGGAGLDARDELLLRLSRLVEQAWEQSSAGERPPDLPARLLVGAVARVLGIAHRRGTGAPAETVEGLCAWTQTYRPSGRDRRWNRVDAEEAGRAASASPAEDEAPVATGHAPQRSRRSGIRERILDAVVELGQSKSYETTTVTDIARQAHVSRDAFYSHFADKEQACSAALTLAFERVMAASAGAFFTSTRSWPDQVWESGLMFARFVRSSPKHAHFGFVRSYAMGRAAAARTDEATLAFTVFLEEGYRYRPEAAALPRVASDAIACATMELVAYLIRHDAAAQIVAAVPLAVYMALAPFTGYEEASEIVAGKQRDEPDRD